MQSLKNIDWSRICKIFFVLLCTTLFLTACGTEEMSLDSGESPEEISTEAHKCWQKTLLQIFYKSLGDIAISVYQIVTAENVMAVMTIAFVLWMAFQILQYVSSTTPESMGEFWTKIIRKAALCLVCGTLASSSANILYTINTFVFPIYITILEYTSEVLKLMGNTPEANAKAIALPGEDGTYGQICETYEYSYNSSGCTISGANVAMSADKFPTEPLDLMGCMTCTVSSRLSVGYTIAYRLFANGGFFGTIIAIFLIAAFAITQINFVFYMVDSIFRLVMMIIIMPFLILFYAFEQTRKWTITGFKIILNSSAIMLCMAILTSMAILAMQNILTNADIGSFGEVEKYNNPGVIPISMLFLGIIILKSCRLAVDMSDSITGGKGGTKFQQQAAAVIGTIGKGMFMLITMGAGKVATFAVEHSRRLKAAAEKVQKARTKMSKAKRAMDRLAGRL